MKTTRLIVAFLLVAGTFGACKKDEPVGPEPAKPTVDKIEIGSNNNGIGVVDRDFHFNAEVIAATKIETVQIKIMPIAGETYSKAWNYEVTWAEYKDAKNATVHKHLTIPSGAAEGKYDFLIIVKDQNGTVLEEKKTINIYLAANLPVDPAVTFLVLTKNDLPYYTRDEVFPNGNQLIKDDKLLGSVTISGVRGDGKMYLLLINKKHNHRPESIAAIDFSKAVVYDVAEHKNMASVGSFSNVAYTPILRKPPYLTIGAASDNNVPAAQPTTGLKAWENGNYYFGIVYTNTTHNMNFFKYIELSVKLD